MRSIVKFFSSAIVAICLHLMLSSGAWAWTGPHAPVFTRQFVCLSTSDRPAKDRSHLGEEKSSSKSIKTQFSEKKFSANWIIYRVVEGDTLSEIARRFGVKIKSIQRWNKIEGKGWIRPGQKLRIYSRKQGVKPHRVVHVVKSGDRWKKIAKRYRVSEGALKQWNRKKGEMLRIGDRLVVWAERPRSRDSELKNHVVNKESIRPDVKTLAIETVKNIGRGARSVGKPNRGRIISAVRMPERKDLYTLRDSNRSWGSSHTIHNLLSGLVRFRNASGFKRQLVIHDISRRSGGRLRPHSSHQSGRDVDIRLPLARSVRRGTIPYSSKQVDWKATWYLIHSLIKTGEIEYVFLDWSRQRSLYRAARSLGVSNSVIGKVLQWPAKPGKNRGYVRHERGHKDHIHVRFRCAKTEKRCVSY